MTEPSSPSYSIVDPAIVRTLPKVVLHDHLDGGLRPQTIIDIAAATGYDGLPTTDADDLEKWFFDAANSGDLPTYLTTFDHTTAVMQTKDALVRVTREAVEDLAADGACYAELRYAPEQHLAAGLSLQEVVEATVQGVKEGEKAVADDGGRIHARLLLCAMRHADRALEIAQLLVDNYGEHSPGEGYVVGFDIAGAEDGFPPSNHVAAFDLLRKNLIPVTVHAGEAAGVESIADGLRQGAVRIGHGVRIYEDIEAEMSGLELGKVAKFVRDRRIPLEICPTSNTQTGICDSVEEHPFNLLYDLGFTCTVNTDNRLVSGCTMSGEMVKLAEAFDLEYWQLLELTTNALETAFCDQPLRESLEREVIYPAYAELGDAMDIAVDEATGAAAASGIDALHGEHLHTHGVGAEEVELSMENLKAELEQLGLNLDDDDEVGDAGDASQ
ncbi:adenosine deaminase [Corynebacterium terpenotabidum]|uniref:adenosine deaminase n=1 Tax=Corynebacterium terpenotabidum Y-11 TaxID=1200352 RepID=S4XIE3_9CORY|nr:adenosine deaminase [Corynebacterium terpenotabidum]AGP31450.1 adenosine deaminase [Corynebacterium terpenotabidum Y-11]